MGKIIGIDLGTTNSCVAVMDGGDVVVIQNSEGGRTTPSIVGYKGSERLVGQRAKNQMITNPENTVYSIKRFMGRRGSEVTEEITMVPYKIDSRDPNGAIKVIIEGKELTPQEISASILQKMKETAEEYLGEKVTEAVITVPAYFNDAQRQATKDAGRIAGLEVKRIVNEPTAAALAYGLNKKGKDEKIAVYDLGGGTFDISILELGDGVFEVKSTNGDTHLGGDNFDQKIIDWLISSFKNEHGVDLSKDKMALQRLKEASENAKKELSSSQSTTINLPFIYSDANGPKNLHYELTRSKFEQLVESLIQRTKEPCLNAIKDSGFSVNEIDEVILVGGSTRIPAVQKLVRELFGKEANKSVNPDEAVAIGAAIQGGVLGGSVKDIILLDVTPLSLGIETLGGVFSKLIERNTTIPTKKSQVFSTAEDNQNAVTINVLQGERQLAAQNRLLGRFDLKDIPPAPRGIPQIEVSFDIDANGILHVSAKDLGTNKEQAIRIESSSGISEAEIQKMLKEAEMHAEEDRKQKEKIEAKNEGESLIYNAEKTLKELDGKILPNEKDEVEINIKNLREALSGDYDTLKSKIESLKQALYRISERVYKESGNAGGTPNPGAQGGEQSQSGNGNKDDVIDADYTVVKDDK